MPRAVSADAKSNDARRLRVRLEVGRVYGGAMTHLRIAVIPADT